MELKTYKQRVEKVLEEVEKTRNDDGTLVAHYIYKYHRNLVTTDQNGEFAIPLRRFRDLPPLENIRRSRQIIQNVDGKFQPTDPEVIKARQTKEKNWREAEVREAKGNQEPEQTTLINQYKD